MSKWKYSRVRAFSALGYPNRFEQAISAMSRILRKEGEYTYLKFKEFETEDGAGEWVVSIIWAHHDGDILEMEAHHWTLSGAFYRCVDNWFYNRKEFSCEDMTTLPLVIVSETN